MWQAESFLCEGMRADFRGRKSVSHVHVTKYKKAMELVIDEREQEQ